MSGRRTVNLNKEPFEGRVRKWTRKWVVFDDKGAVSTQQQPGSSKQPRLLRWVQTDERTAEAPARFRHIMPVKDLSLVPGARLGLVTSVTEIPTVSAATAPDPMAVDAAALSHSQAQSVAASALPAGADAFQQQHQQQQQPLFAPHAAAATSITDVVNIDGPSGGIPLQVAADAAPAGASTASLAAAAAAAGGATGVGVGILQPSTSGVSFGAPSGSFDLVPRPGSYAEAPTPAATGPAASDFTAGTDSGVQGRLPPAGVTASDYTGGTDSMDMDALVGHTQSQGGRSSAGTLPGTAAGDGGGGNVYGEEESDAVGEEPIEPSSGDEQDGDGQFGALRSAIIAEEEEDFDDAEVVSDDLDDVEDDEEEGDDDERADQEGDDDERADQEGGVVADDDDFDNDDDEEEDDMPG